MSENGRSPIMAGGAMASIIPQSFEEVQRLANLVVATGLVVIPKSRKQNDGDEPEAGHTDDSRLIATACVIILKGLEVGLPPMQALETIAVINGRTLIWGDAIPALLWRAGFKIDESFTGNEDEDSFTAYCKITRPDGTEILRSFSIADAKRARLWDSREKVERWVKDWNNPNSTKKVQKSFPNDAPWYRFAKRMLQMRARGFAVKDGASDVTRGLYLSEEYEDNDIVDLTPPQRRVAASAPLPPGQEIRAAIADMEPVQDVSQEAEAEEVSQAQPEPKPVPEPAEKPAKAPPKPPKPPRPPSQSKGT